MSAPSQGGARTVHLMVLDKFIPRFIDFVGTHFDLAEHRFCLMGAPRWEHGLTPNHPVQWVASPDDHIRLVQTLHTAQRIVLHGLWSDAINRLLYALPGLARKAHWVIWGGDLYQAIPTEPTPGWLHQEIVRQGVISQLGGMAGIPGDMVLAQKRYGGQAQHLSTFAYPSNIAPRHAPPPSDRAGVRILVGNSATETNCHLEAFALIARHAKPDMEVHCPLSYGDARYRDLVVANGRALFGDRFKPMLEMLPLAAYNDFLAGIDIAVMHHNRQQAMGNIVSLLALGKKVFMRPDQAHSRYLQHLGMATWDLNHFDPSPLPADIRARNIEIARTHFCADRLADDLAQLFQQDRKRQAS
jgi:hypothetical protein